MHIRETFFKYRDKEFPEKWYALLELIEKWYALLSANKYMLKVTQKNPKKTEKGVKYVQI